MLAADERIGVEIFAAFVALVLGLAWLLEGRLWGRQDLVVVRKETRLPTATARALRRADRRRRRAQAAAIRALVQRDRDRHPHPPQ